MAADIVDPYRLQLLLTLKGYICQIYRGAVLSG